LTARTYRSEASVQARQAARLEYDWGHDHRQADENDLGAQQHRRLLGDQHEACRRDRTNGPDQRLASASGQVRK